MPKTLGELFTQVIQTLPTAESINIIQNEKIDKPPIPATDGTYILQLTVSSGTPTYSWVALSDLSGVTF